MRSASHFTNIAQIFAAVAVMLSLVRPQLAHAEGTEAGTVIESKATMTYKDAKSNSYTAFSNIVKATVTEVYSVLLTCGGDQSVNSNTTAYYACSVKNTGNAKNTFTLAATSPLTWDTVIYHDDGDNGTYAGETTVTGSTGEIGPEVTYYFLVATKVPAGKEDRATAITTVTVTGVNDATDVDDATDTMKTTALAPAITVIKSIRNFSTSGSFEDPMTYAKPKEVLEYRMQVTNSGDVEATEVELKETLHANLEYVPGSMRYSSTATYPGTPVLTNDQSGDTCGLAPECSTGNHYNGVVTFRLGINATEEVGGSLPVSKTVYVFFHAKVL